MSSEPRHATERIGGDREAKIHFGDVNETLLSVQEVVGRKWQPVIVYQLLEGGPMGFSALKDRIDGISSKMLSESLDALETAGLVSRTLLSDRPVRVEYDLTDGGAAMEPLVTEMVQWGLEHDAGDGDDGTTTAGATSERINTVEGE